MNFKLTILILIIGIAFITQACTAKRKAREASNTQKPITILLADSNKIYRLKVNEKFDVALGECIGCAEVWRVEQIEHEKITTLSNTYSGRKCKKCDGGSQVNTFHFQVKAIGSSTLSFRYFNQKLLVYIDGY